MKTVIEECNFTMYYLQDNAFVANIRTPTVTAVGVFIYQ